jgi:hypothetical protein
VGESWASFTVAALERVVKLVLTTAEIVDAISAIGDFLAFLCHLAEFFSAL